MLCGVVALCYDVDNKVPKLIAWRWGEYSNWELQNGKRLRTTVITDITKTAVSYVNVAMN